MKKFIIIQTTFPNLTSAKKLARILLTEKLAACVQLSKIDSFYIWEEKIANSKEILANIKSENNNFTEIEKIITKNHPYKIPQIIKINIDDISENYSNWIESNLRTCSESFSTTDFGIF